MAASADFFKSDTPIHGSPNPDVYPHLHGNGGLSIRQRNVMLTICERWGSSSPTEELEDVFFSRHVAKRRISAPTGNRPSLRYRNDIQSPGDRQPCLLEIPKQRGLADHLDQHLRTAWAMAEARRQLS